jgi:hypothetical protein
VGRINVSLGARPFNRTLRRGIRLSMTPLPDGKYPFIDARFPLADMVMVEAPADLEALFKDQAAKNGVRLMRDQPVELQCRSEAFPDATFLIWWPRDSDRIHMLVPKEFAAGRA